jgi:hypothetical protein
MTKQKNLYSYIPYTARCVVKYGRDFMSENELLRGLGLIGNSSQIPSLDDWREMAYTGSFSYRGV